MSDIEDTDDLHRRVHPEQIKPDGSFSSAAFKDPEMSVDRARLRSVTESLAGHDGHGLAGFSAGFARSLKQEVKPNPDLLNRAHALVLGHKTKSTARSFAKSCRRVHLPQQALQPMPDASARAKPSEPPPAG